jgi:hypothetical protein
MPTKTEQLDFKVNEEWEKAAKENPWKEFIPTFAIDEKGNEYMKGRNRSVAYKAKKVDKNGSTRYECAECQRPIMDATIAHSIHDGPVPGSGSGRVHNEHVPYCPNCEEKPKFHGTPITP